jgi:alkaline phosphatase D
MLAAPGLMRIAAAQSWRAGNPFSLGVASGAPRPDGFVLWTRLAPEPLSTNPETPGGMSGADVTLRYEIATDPAMAKIVRRGSATAEQAFAYSVHLDVAGLQAGRSYWYRFLSGDAVSPVGRAITLPVAESAVGKMRFGFVSCSNYEHGYFSAYRHLTSENPEFVLFLGDYIYETIEQYRPIVRRHSGGVEAATLPTSAIAMRSTGSIWTCKSCMRRCRPSSPGTITKCRTITPTNGRRRSTIRRNS